ncbi:hypothetical protein E8E11_010015 [Didymella keratinophila]|nr:hypothetical protein E8E11_010015 [Didymella keratinophila]
MPSREPATGPIGYLGINERASMPPEIVDANEKAESSSGTVPTSPYVDSEIISLDVGSSATRFLVHSLMLRKSAPLFALASKEQPVSLPKLDEGPAHTLVHHLYAGNFETKFRYAPVGKFRHSTCVYCAAVQYQLTSLAELSKDKIVEAGEGLPIFDILRVARDQAFPLLPETDIWYSQYLEAVIQKAMEKDPEPFRKPDFITRVEGNSRLLQIVWKTVMSNYSVTSAPASTREGGAETPLAESMLTESEVNTQSSQHQLPSPTESVVDSPPTSRAADDLIEPQPLDLSSAKADAEVKSEFEDDFGLPAIEPTTVQAEPLQAVDKPVKEIKKPAHVRTDSVVEEDAATPDNTIGQAKRDSVSEVTPVVSNGNSETSKKGKKKKQKKSSIVF